MTSIDEKSEKAVRLLEDELRAYQRMGKSGEWRHERLNQSVEELMQRHAEERHASRKWTKAYVEGKLLSVSDDQGSSPSRAKAKAAAAAAAAGCGGEQGLQRQQSYSTPKPAPARPRTAGELC